MIETETNLNVLTQRSFYSFSKHLLSLYKFLVLCQAWGIWWWTSYSESCSCFLWLGSKLMSVTFVSDYPMGRVWLSIVTLGMASMALGTVGLCRDSPLWRWDGDNSRKAWLQEVLMCGNGTVPGCPSLKGVMQAGHQYQDMVELYREFRVTTAGQHSRIQGHSIWFSPVLSGCFQSMTMWVVQCSIAGNGTVFGVTWFAAWISVFWLFGLRTCMLPLSISSVKWWQWVCLMGLLWGLNEISHSWDTES